MKIELLRDGIPFMTIEHIGSGSSDDFVVLPKSIVKGSSLSKDSFEELFFKCARESKSYTEAYEQAEKIHEQYFERRRYASFESFSMVKGRK